VGIVPTILLVLFVVALFTSLETGGAPDPVHVAHLAHELGAREAVYLGSTVVVLALLLQPLQLMFVRFAEGYWGGSGLARLLAWPGVAWHRRRRRQLEAASQSRRMPSTALLARMADAAWQLRRLYPREDRLLPTALGNVLRAAEEKSETAYGLDAPVIWPRLYPLLPAALRDSLADQRNQLDLAIRFWSVFLLAGGISTIMLLAYGWWLLVSGAVFVVSWISYRAAIAAALAYGEGIQAAIDLHRFDLLKALHLPLPRDRETERRSNRELCDFLRQGVSVDFQYVHEAESDKSSKASKNPVVEAHPGDHEETE
jgi:hypothetical protein